MSYAKCTNCLIEFQRKPSAQARSVNLFCSQPCYADYRRKDVFRRFWLQVAVKDGCWEWLGKRRNGYGEISTSLFDRATKKRAHILSYFIHNGAWAKNFVCHTCDNPGCVNPAHLFDGTPADNSRDAAIKGRLKRKLTPQQVVEIRKLLNQGVTTRTLAGQFGVGKSLISSIGRRKWWSWLEPNETDSTPNRGSHLLREGVV